VDPVPEPLLLRKSDRAENRTQDLWICSQKLCSHKIIVSVLQYSAEDINDCAWLDTVLIVLVHKTASVV
jgi:hypothetical protein